MVLTYGVLTVAGKLTWASLARSSSLESRKVGQGKYVAMCDHQGRILNDPVLLKLSDRYWFSLADSDMLLWVRAVAAERGFDVEVCEPDVSPLAIQGPKAEDLVAGSFENVAGTVAGTCFADPCQK